MAVTTIFSIAFAGFGQFGFDGAAGTLFSSWMIVIGASLFWTGTRTRGKGWLFSIIAGLGVGSLGFLGMYLVVSSEGEPHDPLPFIGSWDIIMSLIACLFGFILWDICRTKWTIVIVAGPEGIKRQRGVPTHKIDRVRHFVDHMKLPSKIKICALRDSQGTLILRCEGDLSSADRQRLRNFLIDVL